MAAQAQPIVTPHEYLAMEARAPFRSEYVDGRVVAMGGASREHNLIAGAITAALTTALADRPCEVYQSDMRVRVDAARMYVYPDVVVVCGEPELDRTAGGVMLLNPTVLVEVLSESTEHQDRGAKALRYRRLPSLREHLLVAQDAPRVEHFARHGDAWLLTDVDDLDASVELASIGCVLPLRTIYRKVPGILG